MCSCKPWILPLCSLPLDPSLFCFSHYYLHRENWRGHLCPLPLPYIISLSVSTAPVTLESFLYIPPSASKWKALLTSCIDLLYFLPGLISPLVVQKFAGPYLPSPYHSAHPWACGCAAETLEWSHQQGMHCSPVLSSQRVCDLLRVTWELYN